jgi:hypothetical protein
LGGAFLAACGGDSNEGRQQDKSGLLGSASDTSEKAVPGGIWPRQRGPFTGTIDPGLNADQGSFAEMTPVYSTPLKYGFALKGLPSVDTITGDAAQSWELAPGRATDHVQDTAEPQV